MDIVETIESNLFGYLEAFGNIPQGQLFNTPELCWTHTGSSLLNRAFAARLNGNASEHIEKMTEFYQSKQSPVTWMMGPSSTPEHLEDQLIQHEFRHLSDWPGMALPLAQLAPFTLPQNFSYRLMDASDFETWTHIARPGFGLPEAAQTAFDAIFNALLLGENAPFQGYIATIDHQPVSICLSFLRGNAVGIYWVATPPEAQRRGLATALTYQVLNDLKGQAEWAVLHATPAGFKVYERMGFKTHCNIGLYAWSP